MLTDRQLQVLRLLDQEVQPSLQEIAEHLGVASKYTAACHVEALVKKGCVRRGPSRAARSVAIMPAGRAALRRGAR